MNRDRWISGAAVACVCVVAMLIEVRGLSGFSPSPAYTRALASLIGKGIGAGTPIAAADSHAPALTRRAAELSSRDSVRSASRQADRFSGKTRQNADRADSAGSIRHKALRQRPGRDSTMRGPAT